MPMLRHSNAAEFIQMNYKDLSILRYYLYTNSTFNATLNILRENVLYSISVYFCQKISTVLY